jgi:hypothetical protein
VLLTPGHSVRPQDIAFLAISHFTLSALVVSLLGEFLAYAK